MIKFKEVRFKNFIGYGKNITKICLNKSHTTLLIGDSGSGKSSAVTDTITFALFGKPFRNINKSQLVNSINNSDCLVELYFDIGNNQYIIKRGIKPSIFEIYCNGNLINQDSHVRDYQDHLEKNILGMNYKTFIQVVVLGAANYTPFMQLKPADRRVLIEDLLDIEIFSVMSSILKDKFTVIKNDISNVGYELQSVKDKIEIYNSHLDEIKKDKQKQIDENENKIESLKEEIKNRTVKCKEYDESILELTSTVKDESSVNKKLSSYKDYKRDISNNLRNVRKELDFYEKNKVCPTCNRPFDQENTDSLLEEKKNKESDYVKGLYIIETNIKSLSKRIEEIESVHEKIRILNKKKTDEEIKISSSKQFMKKIKDENDNLINSKNDCTEVLSKLEELNDIFNNLQNNKEKLLKDRNIHEIAANILKDGGVKTKIIKQYIPVINKLVNRFLSSMNFNVTFLLDENFNETIKNRGRDDYSYNCFSEGERQRLDMAILLTWRTISTMKNSIQTNLMVLDEIADSSVNHEAAENMVNLFSTENIFKESNIFVISHKPTMVDKFSDSIKFEKVKGFSRIV